MVLFLKFEPGDCPYVAKIEKLILVYFWFFMLCTSFTIFCMFFLLPSQLCMNFLGNISYYIMYKC